MYTRATQHSGGSGRCTCRWGYERVVVVIAGDCLHRLLDLRGKPSVVHASPCASSTKVHPPSRSPPDCLTLHIVF